MLAKHDSCMLFRNGAVAVAGATQRTHGGHEPRVDRVAVAADDRVLAVARAQRGTRDNSCRQCRLLSGDGPVVVALSSTNANTDHCVEAGNQRRFAMPEMVLPDGGRSKPWLANSGTQESSMLKQLSEMAASTTCTAALLASGRHNLSQEGSHAGRHTIVHNILLMPQHR